jgi:hypothetical protein
MEVCADNNVYCFTLLSALLIWKNIKRQWQKDLFDLSVLGIRKQIL